MSAKPAVTRANRSSWVTLAVCDDGFRSDRVPVVFIHLMGNRAITLAFAFSLVI
jgi:hypothetical protein